MHYKDGTEAKLGDVARGPGYNTPYNVQGVVVGLTEGQDQCGIHLAVPALARPLGTQTAPFVTLTEEHGTCSAFDLVYRAPGLPTA